MFLSYRIEIVLLATVTLLILTELERNIPVLSIKSCISRQTISLAYVEVTIRCLNNRGIVLLSYSALHNMVLSIVLVLSYLMYRSLLSMGHVRSLERSSTYRIISDTLLLAALILLVPLPEVVFLPGTTRYILIPVLATPLAAVLEVLSLSVLVIGGFLSRRRENKVSEILVSLDLLLESTEEVEEARSAQ